MEITKQNKIKENLTTVQEGIKSALNTSGREGETVTLVVVTKTQPVEVIRYLYKLGVRDFGENRIHNAFEKQKELKDLADINWHFIGNLQSRDSKNMVRNFNTFHALDRMKIARKLNGYQPSAIIPTYLQFNVSGEESKSGWMADKEENWQNLNKDIEELFTFSNLNIQGLMMMAPFDAEPSELKTYFGRLKKLQQYLIEKFPEGKWQQLSMGMSNDYVLAVKEGATIVRVGTAIVS